ncbi:hypothetical protein ABBQ38_005752 [Trebouxia sp. C0009 RCD-2024]
MQTSHLSAQRRQPVNLLYKLRNRETTTPPAAAQVHQTRSLYACLPPTSLVCKVDPPDTHLCRFTPSGEYLVAFGPVARELVLYRHRAPECSFHGELPADWTPPNAASFRSHFQQVFRVTLAHGTEVLAKDFVLTLHDERFLLVVKTTPPQHGETATSGVAAVPVIPEITLMLVNIRDGSVADVYLLEDEFVHTSHNFGIHLWDNLLLVVGVRQQILYVLQVLPSGRFVKVQALGPHCNDDDQLFLDMFEEKERQWQLQQSQAQIERQASQYAAGPGPSSSSASSLSVPRVPTSSSQAANPLQRAALSQPHGPVAQRGRLGQPPFAAPPLALHSIPSQALPSGPAAPGAGALIQGLKHKLLVYLLKKKQQEVSQGNREALKQFHYVFENYVNLLIWKAQFLDRHHLLIALRTQDPDMARNMDVTPHPVFYVVYDTASSTIRKVTDKNDAGMVQAYLRHAPMFHAADVTSQWVRCVTPAVVGLHPPEEQMGLASRQWNGVLPAVRRTLANVPVNAQTLCASPYLDGNLFHFDEKHISAFVRPRMFSDNVLRFVSKQHPDRVKFKIAGDQFAIPPPHRQGIKQIINYHFHPTLPFVMSYLQTFVAGPQICIHTRL